MTKLIEEQPRVCHQCSHHRFRKDPNDPNATAGVVLGPNHDPREFMRTIWYNQLCGRTLQQRFDPVTGRTEEDDVYCRDVNRHGDCPHWECKRQRLAN